MDWIILTIVLIILGCAATYIIKSKKKGVKCIGCSSGGSCHCDHGESHKEHTCCGCQHEDSGHS